jgi:hypothetical protein
MAKVRCTYCREKIRTDAVKCKHCGSDVSKFMEDRQAKTMKTFVGLLAVIGCLLVISWLTNIISPEKPTTKPEQQNISTSENNFNNLTSAKHLTEAQKALGFKPDSLITLADAKKHLEAIKIEAPEYSEAQKLIREVSRREEDIKRLMSQQKNMAGVDYDLNNNLSKSKCIHSWKYNESAFRLYLNTALCKENETSAALLTIRYIFESDRSKFPKRIEIYNNYGKQLASYPFENIPSLTE